MRLEPLKHKRAVFLLQCTIHYCITVQRTDVRVNLLPLPYASLAGTVQNALLEHWGIYASAQMLTRIAPDVVN